MADKYISVEALFEKTTRRNHIWDGVTNAEGKGLTEIVNDIPPADVRPVVCCKDCIYWKSYPSPTGEKKYCSVFDWINSSTGMDYCSFAERREALKDD